jgi:hypothetical protein
MARKQNGHPKPPIARFLEINANEWQPGEWRRWANLSDMKFSVPVL